MATNPILLSMSSWPKQYKIVMVMYVDLTDRYGSPESAQFFSSVPNGLTCSLLLAQDSDLLGLLDQNVEEAARGEALVLDGLTLADVLALSEEEARHLE